MGENASQVNTDIYDDGGNTGEQIGEHLASADALVTLAKAVCKLPDQHRVTLLSKLSDEERAAVEALAEVIEQ